MTNKYLLTEIGYKKLREEYLDLKNVKRVKIASQIQSAREMGDIQNNLAYDYSLEQQGIVESRLTELNEILTNTEIIEKNDCTEVRIGNTVRVMINDMTERDLHIVTWIEADPSESKISDTSPVGAKLLGKKVGEVVVIETPINSSKYEILEIR